MAVTSTVLIARARRLMYDQSVISQRYSDADYLDMLNEGQIAIATLAPATLTTTASFNCGNDFTQRIPANGFLFVRGHHVVGGPALIPTTIAALDAADPNWRTTTNALATVPRQIAPDPDNPYQFYVSPGKDPSTPLSIILQYALTPSAVVLGGTIGLADVYQIPLVYFMVYKALEADSENPANKALSDGYYQKFTATVLGTAPAAISGAPA